MRRTTRSWSRGHNARALHRIYDMLSTECYDGLDRTLATSIGRAVELEEVDRSAVETLGEWIGFEPGEAVGRAHELAVQVHRAMQRCEDEGIDPGPVRIERIRQRTADACDWAG